MSKIPEQIHKSTQGQALPIEQQARQAMTEAGFTPPDEIIFDGEIHRFSTDGDKGGKKSGWYVLHGDGIPGGAFGDWREDTKHEWRADIGRKWTRKENELHLQRMKEAQAKREAERLAGHEATAKTAANIWAKATPATNEHPYIKKKGIGAHGVKVIVSGSCEGWLAVPMEDIDGKLWNIERIAPEKPKDGSTDKKGLYGGRRNELFFILGEKDTGRPWLVAEGFSTGASLHEATGNPVFVSFNAGNLPHVAMVLHKAYPKQKILICGDDDWATKGNPGRTKAEEAGRAIDAPTCYPVFSGQRGDKDTDFNDLATLEGLEAVQTIVEAVLDGVRVEKEKEPGPGPIECNEEPEELIDGIFPPESKRPCYFVLLDWTEGNSGRKHKPGVYYCSMTEATSKTPSVPVQTWFCAPLLIEALTYDEQDSNYGRLLRFKNSRGRWKEWAMPMELLRGSGEELRGELLAMGLELCPRSARSYLASYLQHKTPKKKIRCALQVGWVGDCFVLPNETIGPNAQGVVFQSGERGHEEFTTKGSLEGWCQEIGAKAKGNPLLMLGLSVAFAGPLLEKCHAESGGLHYVGDSSTGKTTIVEAACSLWGGPNYKRSWRATANGMEGAASMFNDCLLALDEISEAEPNEVGQIVYAIANGRGKQRASRTGAARGVARWRVVVLSSGERTVWDTIKEGKRSTKAGQSIRLLDIPTTRKYGAFDELHGAPTAAAFSDAIKRAAATHYGEVGRAFLRRLTHDTRDFCTFLEMAKDTQALTPKTNEGQAKRAAARFALYALAGELATEYGLTGWQEGEAMKAAAFCFELWQGSQGKGNTEQRQAVEQLRDFLERHGDSRFSDIIHPNAEVRDRAGWWDDSHDSRKYLLNKAGMNEALKGLTLVRALDALQAVGAIASPGTDGKRAKPYRIEGRLVRLYEVYPNALTEATP